MYESPARQREGKPIEEVLPAAINVTASSSKGSAKGNAGSESRKASRAGRELAHGQPDEEPRMAVMRAGSPIGQLGNLPAPLVIGVALALVALVVLVFILI